MNIDNNEILTKVTTTVVTDLIKNAWTKVSGFFKDLEKKDLIEYRTAYEKYIENTTYRVNKIKTIIYRKSPKELYSFYECIGLEYNGENIDTSLINNVICISDKVLITGTGGIGKSTMLKHLFMNAIEKTEKIPLLIELRSLNQDEKKEISLYNFIYNHLLNNGFTLEEKYFEYSMREGAYIILFDGYDEINSERSSFISNEIKNLSTKYNKNKYIVSSRPLEEFVGWSDYVEMTTLPLSKKQALSLINKIEYDEGVKEKFYKELNDNLYEKYETFASNPLLLTIMLLTFDNRAAMPDKLNDFYEQAFSTLFNMHDATKDAYVRDIHSKLGCEDFKLVFSYICFKSYFADEFEFSEHTLQKHIKVAKEKFSELSFDIEDFKTDLLQSVCMLIKDGLHYRFTHRSFQEYFAAWYTCKLPDNVQSKLLLGWIKESTALNTEFFIMLSNLQREKVNQIILCPILKQVKRLYDEYGYSFELLEELFEGIGFKRYKVAVENKEKNIHTTEFKIKDHFLCFGVRMACILNNYSYPEPKDNDLEVVLTKSLMKKTKVKARGNLTFEEALKHVSKDQLLEGMGWVNNQIRFALSILSKYDNTSLGRRKKVESILNQL